MGMSLERRLEKAAENGIRMFSDSGRLGRPSSAANTCIFSVGDSVYVLDPAFGSRRRKELEPWLKKSKNTHVLCTHYHNDHCANNGWIGGRSSRVYYHHRVRSRIHYLRTNGTGQILTMAREMDLPGMMRRFGMFPGWLAKTLVFLSKQSRFFTEVFFFAVSYLYSLTNIGSIRPGWFRTAYLEANDCQPIPLDHSTVTGWQIDKGLYAMEAAGHSDDHLVFYLKRQKALFAGDTLNFLNGNDIQHGDIEKVDQTLDFLYDFVIREKVTILIQGHYYPIFGTQAIAQRIDWVRTQHRRIHDITCSVIQDLPTPFCFDDALAALCTHPSDLARGLAKITFPRSTLVFLDVYLLKVLKTQGYRRGADGKWRRVFSFETNTDTQTGTD